MTDGQTFEIRGNFGTNIRNQNIKIEFYSFSNSILGPDIIISKSSFISLFKTSLNKTESNEQINN